MRACVAALVLAVIVVAASACSKREKGEPADWTAPPVMEQAEQTRGRQACDAYVERLCACVEARPELAQLLGMINGEEGKLGKREMREAQHTARRIIKDCFEKDAALDPASCPR
jgi:hypothetical protein